VAEDIRNLGGTQAFVKDAPVTLVLVADLSKISGGSSKDKKNTANIDAGYIIAKRLHLLRLRGSGHRDAGFSGSSGPWSETKTSAGSDDRVGAISRLSTIALSFGSLFKHKGASQGARPFQDAERVPR
jgi:hypothetical protein